MNMNMKKLIQKMTDIENGKKMLNESVVDECGGSMPTAPQQQGNPVTVSVNFNASGAENVMELLNLLKNSGLQASEGPSMPSQGMRMDMENFRNIVDSGDDENEIDVKFDMDKEKGIKGMSKAESAAWDNEPNEIYADHNTMTKDLSGGLNRQKKAYAKAQDGDNAMAVKHESVDKDYLKSRLLQALEEKKSAKKPDADGDGVPDWADKKPGKDNKDSKPKKGKVPPQFAKQKVDEAPNWLKAGAMGAAMATSAMGGAAHAQDSNTNAITQQSQVSITKPTYLEPKLLAYFKQLSKEWLASRPWTVDIDRLNDTIEFYNKARGAVRLPPSAIEDTMTYFNEHPGRNANR